jgi:hypothetical protein
MTYLASMREGIDPISNGESRLDVTYFTQRLLYTILRVDFAGVGGHVVGEALRLLEEKDSRAFVNDSGEVGQCKNNTQQEYLLPD